MSAPPVLLMEIANSKIWRCSLGWITAVSPTDFQCVMLIFLTLALGWITTAASSAHGVCGSAIRWRELTSGMWLGGASAVKSSLVCLNLGVRSKPAPTAASALTLVRLEHCFIKKIPVKRSMLIPIVFKDWLRHASITTETHECLSFTQASGDSLVSGLFRLPYVLS